jgi:hypothetical protein
VPKNLEEREKEREREHRACNPSYSGGRDQEDLSSKPAGQQFVRLYFDKTYHKKGLVEWLKCRLLVQTTVLQQKRQEENDVLNERSREKDLTVL